MSRRRMKVRRHPLLFRIVHWSLVAETLLLFLSGFSLVAGFPEIFPRYTARNLHIFIGALWIATVLFLLYYMLTGEEYRWIRLSRIGEAFDFFMSEVRHFIEGKKMEEVIRFSPKRGDYIEKVVPTEVLSWWSWCLIFFIMGTTGIFLTIPSIGLVPAKMVQLILPAYSKPFAALRAFHFFMACLAFVFMLIHAYAAFVFGLVPSMITGYREEVVAEEE